MARILVVDDHAYWRELLKDILEQSGHTIVTAENRKTAISAIQESITYHQPFSLVTLDHNLADDDQIGVVESQAVIECLSTLHSPIAVIIISGRADRTDVRDYFRNYSTHTAAITGIIDLDFIDKNEFKVQTFKTMIRVMIRTVENKVQPTAVTETPSAPPPLSAIRRDKVFVSYSHRDKKWLDELNITLKPMVRSGALDIWDDQRIRPGQLWRNEISNALASAKVAILLVSRNFLASDFIAESELPTLLEAAKQEGVAIIWIPVSASGVHQTPIAAYQAAHDPAKPLDSLSEAELSRALVKICDEIQAIFNK